MKLSFSCNGCRMLTIPLKTSVYRCTYSNITPFVNFQQVDARLESPTCMAIDRKLDIPDEYHGPRNSNNSFRQSSATYHPDSFGLLLFPNTSFPGIPPPSIGLQGVPPIPPTESGSPDSLQDSNRALSQSLCLY